MVSSIKEKMVSLVMRVYLHWSAFGFCARCTKVGDQEIKCTHIFLPQFLRKLASKERKKSGHKTQHGAMCVI